MDTDQTPIIGSDIFTNKEIDLTPVYGRLNELFQFWNSYYFKDTLKLAPMILDPSTRTKAKGSFTQERIWVNGEYKSFEIKINANTLNRPLEDICLDLLHNMVHYDNAEKNIKDTCREGYYHKKIFKEIAETKGLNVSRDSSGAWNTVTLNEESKRIIKEHLNPEWFNIYRDHQTINKKTKKSNSIKHSCPLCGFTARTTKNGDIIHVECLLKSLSKIPNIKELENLNINIQKIVNQLKTERITSENIKLNINIQFYVFARYSLCL